MKGKNKKDNTEIIKPKGVSHKHMACPYLFISVKRKGVVTDENTGTVL